MIENLADFRKNQPFLLYNAPNTSFLASSQYLLNITCPNSDYRDGSKAVKDAIQARELTIWKEGNNLDTFVALWQNAVQQPAVLSGIDLQGTTGAEGIIDVTTNGCEKLQKKNDRVRISVI